MSISKILKTTALIVGLVSAADKDTQYATYFPYDSSTQYPAGIAGSISIETLNEFKDFIYHKVISTLGKEPLPNTELDDGLGHLNDMHLTMDEDHDNILILSKPETNALSIQIRDLNATFTCQDFLLNYGLIQIGGQINADIRYLSLDIDIELGATEIEGGILVPKVNFTNVMMEFETDNMDLSLTESGCDYMYNSIIWMVKSIIKSNVIYLLQNELFPKTIPPIINDLMISQKGIAHVSDGFDVDYSLAYPPMVGQYQIDLGISGLVYDQRDPDFKDVVIDSPPNMYHHHDWSTQKVQLFVSEYFVRNLFNPNTIDNQIHIWTYANTSSAALSEPMTTKTWNKYQSGVQKMFEEYGSELPMDQEITILKLDNFNVDSAKTIELSGDVKIAFHVRVCEDRDRITFDNATCFHNKTMEFELENMKLKFQAEVKGKYLYFTLLDLGYKDIDFVYDVTSHSAKLSTFTLLANTIGKVFVPSIKNWVGTAKIPLPSPIAEIIEYKNLVIYFENEFIGIYVNPTFLEMPEEEEVESIEAAWEVVDELLEEHKLLSSFDPTTGGLIIQSPAPLQNLVFFKPIENVDCDPCVEILKDEEGTIELQMELMDTMFPGLPDDLKNPEIVVGQCELVCKHKIYKQNHFMMF